MSVERSPAPGGQAKWKAIARTWGPWVVLVLALLFVMKKVVGLPPDPLRVDKLRHAMEMLPVAQFLTMTAVLLVLNCAADSLAMYFTFGWFGCRLPYRELFIIRAATYLLAVVQYFVGQAAIVGFLYQRRNVDPLRASGWILFISGINLGVLVLLAAVGLAAGDSQVWWLRLVPVGVAVGAGLYAWLLWRKPQGLVRTRMLAPLFEAGIVGHIKAVIVRLPHVMVLIVWHYIALHMFGVMVPFAAALVLLPAVFFAAALPFSPQGVGLTQVAAIYFLSGYVQSPDPTVRDAAVLAYSATMTVVSIIVQLVMGASFLPAAKRLGLSDVRTMPAKVSDLDAAADAKDGAPALEVGDG